MPITTITSNATLGLATASRALVSGVGTHQSAPTPVAATSAAPSSTNVKRGTSGMRKNVSRDTGNMRDRVRKEVAEMLHEAGRPIQEQQGVMAAIATVSRWLGWSASKCRRHWYEEIQTVAAHDYIHAQQVLMEKRRRLEQAREDLKAAQAAFNAASAEGD